MSVVEIILIALVCVLIIVIISLFIVMNKKIDSNKNLHSSQPHNVDDSMQQNLDSLKYDLQKNQQALAQYIANDNERFKSFFKEQQQLLVDNVSQNFKAKLELVERTLNDQKENIQRQNQIQISNNAQFEESIKAIKDNLTSIVRDTTSLSDIKVDLRGIQDIFKKSKTRGITGEFLLESILNDSLGPKMSQETGCFWQDQYRFSNEAIIDFVIKTKNKNQFIGIDSKFPLDNYSKIWSSTSDVEKENAKKEFVKNIKDMIISLRQKYVDKHYVETLIMYIPSESVFQYICDELSNEILAFAFKNKIYLSSPTSINIFLYYLNKNIQENSRVQNIEKILSSLSKLETEIKRWQDRWDSYYKLLVSTIDSPRLKDLNTTNDKIVKQFKDIMTYNKENNDTAKQSKTLLSYEDRDAANSFDYEYDSWDSVGLSSETKWTNNQKGY